MSEPSAASAASAGVASDASTPGAARAANAASERPGEALAPVAYVMSRFPKLTETFILDELVAVDRAGLRVELFPLLRERADVVHPEAEPWVRRAHYLPFLSPAIVASNLSFLVRHPRRYLGTLAAMLRGTAGSLNFYLGGIGIFPKVVHAARRMEALGVGHVHCHFATHPALAGFLVHRLVGIPFSFTAHGSDLHVDRTMLCRKVSEAAFVVTISRSNAAVFEAECGGPIETLRVVHCGIDGRVFRPNAVLGDAGVRADPPPDGPLTIACVGTLHEVKGQTHLVEAAGELVRRGVDLRVRFVGDGPDRAELERLAAALLLGERVEFLGQRTRAEVVGLLGNADILVAPSVPTAEGKREGLPVVLIEAMAAGVPVVASHLSGIPELVEDGVTGLTVTPGDSTALADAIGRLAADPVLRSRLAEAGRARVTAEFDLDTNARRLIELFAASQAGQGSGA
ncbi:MAG TPA: glycosyltransferase family 4 protein [Candidatus Limnocylindrales bacterium]|nr:glycosyltransferase family 4 protein [Candidatus Limnocylindrales bacterium]